MNLIFSETCPGWIKQHVNAALAVMGNDPVRIGKHLDSLPNPMPDLRWHESSPGLFVSHGYVVAFGLEDRPWLSISPINHVMNRDEVVRLH